MGRPRAAWIIALAASLGVACAGTFPYRGDLDENMTIRTKTSSGSIFSSVRAALDVYRFDDECRPKYEGTVDLQPSEVDIALPVNRATRLVFNFASSSWLSNTRGSIAYDTVIRPRAAHDYAVDVRYVDDTYLVEIDERGPRGRGLLAPERGAPAECAAGS